MLDRENISGSSGPYPPAETASYLQLRGKGLTPFIFSLFPFAFRPVSLLLLPETKNGFPSGQLLRRHLPRKTKGYRNSTSGASDCLHVHPAPHPSALRLFRELFHFGVGFRGFFIQSLTINWMFFWSLLDLFLDSVGGQPRFLLTQVLHIL